MIAKKFVLATAVVATLATSMVGTTTSAQAGNGAAWAAGAAGLVGGLIVGGALAEQSRPVYVERRPVRVYEEEQVVVRPRCWREVWYDNWGDRHVRRLCR